MTSSQKLDIIIKAIIKTKEANFHKTDLKNPSLIKLDISIENCLAFIGREEAISILKALEIKDKIIELSAQNYACPIIGKTILGHYEIDTKTNKRIFIPIKNPIPSKTDGQPEPNTIYLKLKPDFDNWLDHYTMVANRKLEDFDQSTLLYMLDLALIIDQKVHLSPTPRLRMDLSCQPKFFELSTLDVISELEERRLNALNFFKQQEAVDYTLIEHRVYGMGEPEYIQVEITVFAKKWPEFLQRLKSLQPPQAAKGDQTKEKPASPSRFSPDTKWEDITLRFIDGNNVEIKAGKDIKVVAHYKELGLEDKRTRSPNTQWSLLEYLSQHGGQISWDSPQANETVKKKKQRLSKALQEYFKITEDPFFPYKSEGSYTCRIQFNS